MEVSPPVKIIEGNTNILGVTLGSIPGTGECTVITSSSAINVYSMVNKTVIATWTFPTNQRECITSPAFITKEGDHLVACKGKSTLLQWQSTCPSTKDFTSTQLKEPCILVIPVSDNILIVSESFHVSVVSSKAEVLVSDDLPKYDRIVKYEISKLTNYGCTVSCILQCGQSYKVVLIQCSNSPSLNLRIVTADLPVNQEIPCGLIYSSSTNTIAILSLDGRYTQYKLHPNPTSGSYTLELCQSMQLIVATISHNGIKRPRLSNLTVTWDTCFVSVGDRCLAYVSCNQSIISIHIIDKQYMNELAIIEINSEPSSLCCLHNHLLIIQGDSVSLSQVSFTSLSLADIILSTDSLSLVNYRLQVDSQVKDLTSILRDVPTGIMNETEWRKRCVSSTDMTDEEEKLLNEEDPIKFIASALQFVAHRKKMNCGVISLDTRFLAEVTGRCLSSTGHIHSEMLRQLLQSGVDICVNHSVLPALMAVNDIETLLLVLLRVPVISTADLICILNYCISLSPSIIQSFALQMRWTHREAQETKRQFLMLIGPQVLRIRCDLGMLRQSMRKQSMDDIYNIGLLLTALLVNLDNPIQEEKMIYERFECHDGRLYASSLTEWINALIDANLMRMVVEAKTDERFKKLIELMMEVVESDAELYKNLLPLKGVVHHLEHKLPLPVSSTPLYVVERLEF